MKLVLLFGPSASGKMTIGQELAKITGLKLFHNHVTIEPVLDLFDRYDARVINGMRDVVFEEFARSGQYGMIFTFVWYFDSELDWDYVRKVVDIFERRDADVYFVELDCPLDERLRRNVTGNRLRCKPSKRDTLGSEALLRKESQHRLVSSEGEIKHPNFLRIENEHLPAREVASMVKNYFRL